tara:strand:- start:81 stop:287 length:207 start_codon:yes stop_codon:yes gene_type:complete
MDPFHQIGSFDIKTGNDSTGMHNDIAQEYILNLIAIFFIIPIPCRETMMELLHNYYNLILPLQELFTT